MMSKMEFMLLLLKLINGINGINDFNITSFLLSVSFSGTTLKMIHNVTVSGLMSGCG